MSEGLILALHPCYICDKSIDLPPVNWYAIRNPEVWFSLGLNVTE